MRLNFTVNAFSSPAFLGDTLDSVSLPKHDAGGETRAVIPVCPKCDVELFILRFKDVEVDFCHRCRGLWLDAGELEALLQQTGARTDDPILRSLQQEGTLPSGGKHLCPRCDKPLREISVTQVGTAPLLLDRCPANHGLWFDADELEELLADFAPESGASKTKSYLNELLGMKNKT